MGGVGVCVSGMKQEMLQLFMAVLDITSSILSILLLALKDSLDMVDIYPPRGTWRAPEEQQHRCLSGQG